MSTFEKTNSLLWSWHFLKALLALLLQPGTSFGILIQLDFVVILVMAQNCDALVHKVIVWQLDIVLSSEIKQTSSGQVHWAGCRIL